LTGKLADGLSSVDVIKNLRKNLFLSDDTIKALFVNRAKPLKQNLTSQQAILLSQKLEECGLSCLIEVSCEEDLALPIEEVPEVVPNGWTVSSSFLACLFPYQVAFKKLSR
jgi:hypothetical protein